MTPQKVCAIIKNRFLALLNGGMLDVGYHKNILKLSGSIVAVQAVNKYVMQGLIPNHCKPMEKSEENGKSTYTYKF